MKTMKSLLAATVLTSLATGAIAATDDNGTSDDVIPTGIRVEGGITGYGGAIQWKVNPYVGVSLGYNGGNISGSDDLNIKGSRYDQDVKNEVIYLNTEIHPWGGSKNNWSEAFYIAAGVASIDSKRELERSVEAGQSFSVDRTSFTAISGVKVEGKLDYKKTLAPYVGLGYSPKLGKNWGVFAEGGAYYSRNPTVRLKASGQVADGRQAEFQQAVRNEAQYLAGKKKYAWTPVAKVGITIFW